MMHNETVQYHLSLKLERESFEETMFQGKKALLVCEEDATIASLGARPSAVEYGGQNDQLLERAATFASSNNKG